MRAAMALNIFKTHLLARGKTAVIVVAVTTSVSAVSAVKAYAHLIAFSIFGFVLINHATIVPPCPASLALRLVLYPHRGQC